MIALNLPMPENCADCWLEYSKRHDDGLHFYCPVLSVQNVGNGESEVPDKGRRGDCPLIEIE